MMKIIQRKSSEGTLLHVGTKMHASILAEPEVSDNEAAESNANFKFGLFNGALLVAPFWIIIIWLITR